MWIVVQMVPDLAVTEGMKPVIHGPYRCRSQAMAKCAQDKELVGCDADNRNRDTGELMVDECHTGVFIFELSAPNDLFDCDDLIQWTRDNHDGDHATSPMDKVIRFICCQEAEFMRETYSVSDLADLIEEGCKPWKTVKEVDDWLEERYTAGEDKKDEEQVREHIEHALREHFGLNK